MDRSICSVHPPKSVTHLHMQECCLKRLLPGWIRMNDIMEPKNQEKSAMHDTEQDLASAYRLKQYGHLIEELEPGEALKAFTFRKSNWFTGIFSGVAGFVLIVMGLPEASHSHPPAVTLGSILTGLFFLVLCVYVVRIPPKEYVALTDRRLLIYCWTWKGKKNVLKQTIPLDQIETVRMLRPASMLSSSKALGDLLIRLKSRKQIILTSLQEGRYLMEGLMTELTATNDHTFREE